ncbi:hypothetical protein BGZ96_003380 [Linnemannia gamsii]|uniref:Uncharacterized protein n=1 Tax=Linnemannia gamsii TaxID=64522 RepID=A0ABQ7K7R4_9FUNG|nr:hypothetical protein BGZ96_003380 [Linnemannia gamsii]
MSQPSTAAPGASDPEGRCIPFLNADLHEQDISDPYVKRLATSDHHQQLPPSPPPVPQSKNVGPSMSSAMMTLSSSSTPTSMPKATVLGSSTGLHSTGAGGAGGAGGNGTSLPVRGGPSTAFGGLVTNASGAPTAAIPGLVFSSRGDNTGSRTQFHAPLEPEVVAKLDDIFFKFLQRICSDLKACDAKGDHIHQPLMAKKMERLEASTEFRPFKFRIQAFTNAFHDSLIQHGLTEDVLPLRKVKLYLWKHRYISRFNEDGKKQKSKGNHVWNIEARKISNVVTLPASAFASGSGVASSSASATPSVATPSTSSVASTPSIKASSTTTTATTGFYDLLPPDMDPKHIGPEAISAAGGGLGIIRRPSSPVRWEFREYSSRIAGQVIKYARVGVPYVYSPRIWDAQMSCPAAKFSSPWLPSWLKWHRGELKGIPSAGDESCTILVVAEYVREGEECRLEMSFPLTVCDPSKEVVVMQQQHTPSGISGEEDSGEYFERGSGGSNGDSAGAVGVTTSAGQDGDSLKMQLEESSGLQQQHGRKKDGDEEMMMATKEDEDMGEEENEELQREEHEQTASYNLDSRPYYSHYHSHGQQQDEFQATTTSPRQEEHQREQRQAQQRLQRLQLQEYQHHQQQREEGEDHKPALFHSRTAPSSAGTTASFYMNPPSSRGSISSSNGSSAYVEEEEESESEQSEDEDDSDGGEEGMESTADGDDDEAGKSRKMKTRISTRTSTSSSTSTTRRGRTSAHRRKPSRDHRSTILLETNKRRKHG